MIARAALMSATGEGSHEVSRCRASFSERRSCFCGDTAPYNGVRQVVEVLGVDKVTSF